MASTIPTIKFSNQAELTEFVFNKGNGVKGLSETGIKSLPDQYIQTFEELAINKSVKETNNDEAFPVIDMSNPDENKVAQVVCEAAEKWGFFQVINHGVPIEVHDNIQAATHRFFNLPTEEKIKFTKENSMSPNVFYTTSLGHSTKKHLNWMDQLCLIYDTESEARQLWPNVCRNEVLTYMNKTKKLMNKLLVYLETNFNVKKLDETKESLFMAKIKISLNYYPICPNPDLAAGANRHSDGSSLTILLQDQVGGLQARSPLSGNWIHVPPVPGSLVVNIGDVMQIISNGRYKSAEHRVMANGNYNRISVPFFAHPKVESVIGPLPEVILNGEEPIYRDLIYSDYIAYFFKKEYNGRRAIDFAKI